MAGPLVYGSFAQVKIDYTDDHGDLHSIPQRGVVQTAVGNVVATTVNPGRPSRWKLRHILLEYIDTGTGKIYRKRVVIGDPTNAHFVNGTNVTGLDGQTWVVQGRIGEKRST